MPNINNEEADMEEEYGADSWEVRWYKYLHIHKVIFVFALLMLIDVIMLMVILILESIYPKCYSIEAMCECLPEATCQKECIGPPHSVEDAIKAMNIISLVILLIFLIEVLVQIACIGCKRFSRHPFLIIDLLVILASIGIEVYAQVEENIGEGNATETDAQAVSVSLLLVSRSWRLVRISHSTLSEAHEYYEEQVDKFKQEIANLKQQVHQLKKGQNNNTGEETGGQDIVST